MVPKTPSFDKEAADAVKYDGTPPLASARTTERVTFINVKNLWTKDSNGKIVNAFSTQQSGVVHVTAGQITSSGSMGSPRAKRHVGNGGLVVDLAGGSISPGLVSYGAPLGLGDIVMEPSTQDGRGYDWLLPASSILDGIEVKAMDGLVLGTRDELCVRRVQMDSSSIHRFVAIGSLIALG